jgi:MFS family permease
MAITGLCYGALFSVFPAATADLFGLKNFGANFGLLFTAWGLSGIIGPLTAARVFDVTGAYNRAYLIAGCLVIISLILSFTFKKRQTA